MSETVISVSRVSYEGHMTNIINKQLSLELCGDYTAVGTIPLMTEVTGVPPQILVKS